MLLMINFYVEAKSFLQIRDNALLLFFFFFFCFFFKIVEEYIYLGLIINFFFHKHFSRAFFHVLKI
jgi:membrane protease YdiL (CAAX protease family)